MRKRTRNTAVTIALIGGVAAAITAILQYGPSWFTRGDSDVPDDPGTAATAGDRGIAVATGSDSTVVVHASPAEGEQHAYPYIDFTRPVAEQVTLYPGDRVYLYGSSETLSEIDFGLGWQRADFDRTRPYIVAGIIGRPIVPRFRCVDGQGPRAGGIKLDVVYTEYREHPRTPTGSHEFASKP